MNFLIVTFIFYVEGHTPNNSVSHFDKETVWFGEYLVKALDTKKVFRGLSITVYLVVNLANEIINFQETGVLLSTLR